MLKEFSVWLCTRVPGLTLGGNVQVGYRAQDAPVQCHALVETGGPADFDLSYRTDMMLQVMTRAANVAQAREDAWAIYSAIHGTSGWTIGPLVSGGQQYKLWTIEAMAKPQYLGQDEKLNHEYSCNYLIRASPI